MFLVETQPLRVTSVPANYQTSQKAFSTMTGNLIRRYSQQLKTGTLSFGRHYNVWLCCWYSAKVVTEVLRKTPFWVVRRTVPTFLRSVRSSFLRASSPGTLLSLQDEDTLPNLSPTHTAWYLGRQVRHASTM